MIVNYGNNKQYDLTDDILDNSVRYRQLREVHSLTLNFSLGVFIDFPVGSWVEYPEKSGKIYTLEVPENFKKKNTENFEYTLILEDETAKTKKYKYKDTATRRLKFTHTATPQGHLKMLVDNLNLRDSGWKVGECISSAEKTLSFNHSSCYEVVGQLADAYSTEWEFVNKTIHLRKVEYNKTNPLKLSYGRGKGFKSGVGRSNFDSSRPFEILYVQGGDRNINPTKYGSTELLLPKSQELEYEGRIYVSDADGYSITRKGIDSKTKEEGSLDCSHIYPQRIGVVSAVAEVDVSSNFYDFIDANIPSDLDYNECLIDGESMSVIFQDGMLTGKEFEVKYHHNAVGGKLARRFEIVPQELDGRTMPDASYKPAKEQRYGVFGISLPASYVCNDNSKKGASWDMFREAAKFLYENEDPRFTFTGDLDGLWAKKDWLNIVGKIKLGGYVRFSDTQFQPEPNGINIRIVGIKDYVNNPHSPTIELSNCISGGSVVSELNKIAENEVVADDLTRDVIKFAKRRFRDAQETAKMLEDTFDNFSGAISPVSVNAMQLIAGDKSLQFMFVAAINSSKQVPHDVDYNKGVLTVDAGILKHLTIGITSLSSSHKPAEYKYWDMEAFSTELTSPLAYYLYAKVSRTGVSGKFYISHEDIKIEDVSGYYHLLVGILNSEFNGERSWAQLYGFSELTPGQMLVERIVSPDGLNYLDFVRNAFRVGNDTSFLDWNNLEEDTLTTVKMRLQDAVIKNRLDVIGEAFLAGMLFSNEKIQSEKKVGNVHALTIDGKNGHMGLNSLDDIYTEHGGSKQVKKNITISSNEGRVETQNDDNETAYMSTQGIFANKAGVNPLPSSSGISMYTSVAGLGFGKMDKNSWGSNWCICGVYGHSSNSSNNPAPSYGGYFDKLRANGLFVMTRRINNNNTYLSLNDVYISCYNTIDIRLWLPSDPYDGMVLIIRRMNPSNFVLDGNGKSIHIDGNTPSEVWGKNGRGDTVIVIYDGQYWNFNYWVR